MPKIWNINFLRLVQFTYMITPFINKLFVKTFSMQQQTYENIRKYIALKVCSSGIW